MNKNLMKRLIILGGIIFLIYTAIPKVYNTKSSKTIYLEQFETYLPTDIFEEEIKSDTKLFIRNQFGLKEISPDQNIKIEEDTQAKIVYKQSPFKTKTITYDIRTEDTIPPKIIVDSNKITLRGGENLNNVLDVKVMDYRYGEYNFELKPPKVDFVSLIPGQYEYEIIADDLAGNKASTKITIINELTEIPAEEAHEITAWVNKVRKLPKNFKPELETLPEQYAISENSTFELHPEAKKHYIEMTDTLKKDLGSNIYVTSAYRSYEYQSRLFEQYSKKDGAEKANSYSALPGHSEHQTGLAIDVRTKEKDIYDFHNTLEFEWIQHNAHKFGFIIRYPEEKEDITGYQYEPWHLRFVGKTVAKFLYDNELTLDEYMLQNMQ